jgi:bifunctional UDP-N-acetylglucosamine pyrophosphorylase/glucosamine-1-phosphate N-acetyltransferase
VAAGSTVTKDVPPGALAIARSRQTNISGWADRAKKGGKRPMGRKAKKPARKR